MGSRAPSGSWPGCAWSSDPFIKKLSQVGLSRETLLTRRSRPHRPVFAWADFWTENQCPNSMCLRHCHCRGPVRRFGRSKYQWSEIGGRLLQTSRRFDAMSKKRSAACQHLPARRSQSIRRCGPQTIQLIEPRLAPFVLLMQKLVFFRYLATCNYQENYSTSHGDIEQIYESEHGLAKFKRYCVVAHSQSYQSH